MSENASVLAWHFLPNDGRLQFGRRNKVAVGRTLSVKPPLRLCSHGLHASKRAIDALGYAPGALVCRVELSGEVVEGDDKLCAQRRKVLWMADATHVLHEFACRCAEDALKAAKVDDKRCWNAIAVKRLWLAKRATNYELDAAWAAARAVAWAAAWGADKAVAWAAAGAAAKVAAWAAAGAAAKVATMAAVRAATSDAQNTRLEKMLYELNQGGKQ